MMEYIKVWHILIFVAIFEHHDNIRKICTDNAVSKYPKPKQKPNKNPCKNPSSKQQERTLPENLSKRFIKSCLKLEIHLDTTKNNMAIPDKSWQPPYVTVETT